jgi:CMP-N-acetylneuraminic acid synthetase
MKNSLIAIIPARFESARLPNKNLLDFGGKPLLQWTLQAAQEAKLFDEIILSTDDWRAEQLGHEWGTHVIRQSQFAQDENASLNVVLQAIKHRVEFYGMLLQPTSPFRTANHIREVWDLFQTIFPNDALVSVNPFDQVNGAIYLFTLKRIRAGLPIYEDEFAGRYSMSWDDSLDIDTESDLEWGRLAVAARR